MQTETWKDIKDYEGLYQASSLGRIARLTKSGNLKILKPSAHSDGYQQLNLCKNGKPHLFKVHKLIAQTFIPNPDNKPCVDHINTIRTDNRVENLRWATVQENCNNPLTTLNNIKSNRKVMKPVVQMTHEGLYKQIYRSQEYAGKINSKSQVSICNYCKHTSNDPTGDKWELLENIDFIGSIGVVGRCSFIPLWVS